jgi:hypothetical protein
VAFLDLVSVLYDQTEKDVEVLAEAVPSSPRSEMPSQQAVVKRHRNPIAKLPFIHQKKNLDHLMLALSC